MKVINDNGKDSKSKKYMWLYMTQTEDKPIILLVLPRSSLGKALDYAKKHVPSLKTILLDERLKIDDSAADLKIKDKK